MVDEIDPLDLQRILRQYLSVYRILTPHYQATMLNSLRRIWLARHSRLLDVGGGTGVIAQAISELLDVEEVNTIDLVDRFCPKLTVAASQYDGRHIPFPDNTFNAATLINVLHHVPGSERIGLLREIRRSVDGPLYIKDHEASGRADRLRLFALDALGNLPFNGMIAASYLSRGEWEDLAAGSGYRITERFTHIGYRRGPFQLLFPNRLEVTMRFEPS